MELQPQQQYAHKAEGVNVEVRTEEVLDRTSVPVPGVVQESRRDLVKDVLDHPSSVYSSPGRSP